jgi:Hydroxypyruvate isomerase
MKFSAAGGWFGVSNCEAYEAAAKKGFIGVEQLGWLGLDFEKARAEMVKNNITSTAIVIQSQDKNIMDKIQWSHGMVWEDTRELFIQAFKESIVAAKALGVPNIIATTGNERSDISRCEQHKIVVDTLKCLAPMAEEAGLMIILEPLNILVDHKGYFLVTSEEAFEVIREVNSPNVTLLFDIYHQQISEGNLINNITKNIDLIGHFHIADNPGRREPGTGEINYKNVFAAIKKAGYSRWLAFECGRSVDVDTLCTNMHNLIDEFC